MRSVIRVATLFVGTWLLGQSTLLAMRAVLLDDKTAIPTRIELALVVGHDPTFLTRDTRVVDGLVDAALQALSAFDPRTRRRCVAESMPMVLARLMRSKDDARSCGQQVFVAAFLDRILTKREIVREVARRAYFGGGRVGIDDAARSLFHKTPHDLSIAEAALLVGVMQAPSRFLSNVGSARARTRYMVDQMRRRGNISDVELANAYAAIDDVASRAVAAHKSR